MDIYHIFAYHHADVDGYEFAEKMRAFLDGLVDMDRMQSYRLTRAKLGFRSMDLPEFHVMMEFNNMQQLDDAMTSVIRNEESIDEKHVNFNQLVDTETIQHFLYRDFPDQIDGGTVHRLIWLEVDHHKSRTSHLHHGEVEQPTRQTGQQVFQSESSAAHDLSFCRCTCGLRERIQKGLQRLFEDEDADQ